MSNFNYTKVRYEAFIDLTAIELYLYVRLIAYKSVRFDRTYTSIDMISQDIQFSSRESRNKIIIEESLESLHDKGYIIIFSDDIKYKTTLKITFPFFDVEKNYVMISFEEQSKFSNPEEFFVYSYIKKWNKIGCKLSYPEWAEILKVKSEKTAKNILCKLNDDNIIDIYSGSYYVSGTKPMQDKNSYKITPNNKESVKHKTRDTKNSSCNDAPAIAQTPVDIPDSIMWFGDKISTTDIRNRILHIRDSKLLDVDYAYIQEYGEKDEQCLKRFNLRLSKIREDIVNSMKSNWNIKYLEWQKWNIEKDAFKKAREKQKNNQEVIIVKTNHGSKSNPILEVDDMFSVGTDNQTNEQLNNQPGIDVSAQGSTDNPFTNVDSYAVVDADGINYLPEQFNSPITDWKSQTIEGKGCGPTALPRR